ncbi:hypothetical protein FRB93_003128 [Tulasnella sp. JGI-2019a]|nr:hypothetical protein FRB93_003128 [Tulasnella sp. JGI-2019a]
MSTDGGPSSLAEIFVDVPSSSSQSTYLSHLTSLSLPQLLQEPATLASEASFLTSELTNLCHSQYATFLSLHNASTALSTSFASFSSSLSALVDAVPNLESQCASFAQETRALRSERRKVTTVLEHHEKLLDILQIPQLIDTCVKNGYYQEALDLAAHTKSLVKEFPTITIVRSVEAEVATSINQMHSQLLHLLQEPAKHPALFKAVNFLRRMAVLDEEELALAFLTSRGAHMQSLFEAIERERTMDATRFLKKWIDIWREGLYDVVTQFTSMFLERTQSGSQFLTHPTVNLRPFLVSFTHMFIQKLLDTLSTTVPTISDSHALSSLLTKLSYCSAYFGGIGLDFRGLFPPIFERAALDNFKHGTDTACGSLRLTLDTHTGKGRAVRLPSTWIITSDALDDPPQAPHQPPTGSSAYIPPSFLTSFPPLAQLINALLVTLNSLRLLAPTAILPSLLVALDTSLNTVSASLLNYSKVTLNRSRRSFDMNESTTANEKEKAVILAAMRAWVYIVKFVRRGLVEGVYGRKLGDVEKMVRGSDVQEGDANGLDWLGWEAWLNSIGAGNLYEEVLLGAEPVVESEKEVKTEVNGVGDARVNPATIVGEAPPDGSEVLNGTPDPDGPTQ